MARRQLAPGGSGVPRSSQIRSPADQVDPVERAVDAERRASRAGPLHSSRRAIGSPPPRHRVQPIQRLRGAQEHGAPVAVGPVTTFMQWCMPYVKYT